MRGVDSQPAVLQHRHRHVLITVTRGPMEKWRENKGTQRQVKGHRTCPNVQQALLIAGVQRDYNKMLLKSCFCRGISSVSLLFFLNNNLHISHMITVVIKS